MPRSYPIAYYAEFTGDAPSSEWVGTVNAMYRTQAVILATVKAHDEGTTFSENTHVYVDGKKL